MTIAIALAIFEKFRNGDRDRNFGDRTNALVSKPTECEHYQITVDKTSMNPRLFKESTLVSRISVLPE